MEVGQGSRLPLQSQSATTVAPLAARRRSPGRRGQDLLRSLVKRKASAVGLGTCFLVVLVAIAAPILTPYDPVAISPTEILQGPSWRHWLGTDEIGRDVLTRVIHAGRVSLNVGLFVALISGVVGVVVGSLAGYFGGVLDQLLMRTTDLFLLVPSIAIVSMAQRGLESRELPVVGRLTPTVLIVVLLSFLFWMQMGRVVRGLILSLKEKEFIEAARASGASSFRIITRHILPNIIGPIAVNITLVVALAIVVESTVSFLGFGLKPPAVSWGTMLNIAQTAVGTPNAYLIYFPGLALLLTVLCVNFLGDGLRDAFDPQSGKH